MSAVDSTEQRPSKAPTSLAIGLLAVVAIVLLIYFSVRPNQPKGGTSKGLQRNGWVLYTRPGCGFCDKQRTLLGSKFLNTQGNVTDCGSSVARGAPVLTGGSNPAPAPAPVCGDPRIVAYPFWYCKTTGEIRVGLQDANQLREMAGTRST